MPQTPSEFSGKWYVKWHGMIWGPFNTQAQAESFRSLSKNTNAPQDFEIHPMFNPYYMTELIKEWSKDD